MARHQSKGFTLIEVIASVVILAIALPPMLWALSDAQSQRVEPIQLSRARWLACEKIEDVIADRHSATRGYKYIQSANYTLERRIDDFPGYTRRVEIKETGPDLKSTGKGYKTVTVIVEWEDISGKSRTLSLPTVLTDYQP